MSPAASTRRGPLAGIRIIDLSRLAPGPYCTMLLADLGAEVIVVGGGRAGDAIPEFSRGKTHMALNLKSPDGRAALRKLVETADVLVEGFRPGVAERIGAGYADLAALNPRLVYCALTGFGQDGPRAQEAGHDITYLALSGVLGGLGPAGAPPQAPLNLVADFAGGSLMAAFGILAAVIEAQRTGQGRFIDAAMMDGSLSLMAMHLPLWRTPVWPERGEGLLGGGAPFYRTYACSDGGYVAVGALEAAFFATLWQMLDLGEVPDHMNRALWPDMERTLAARFASQPRTYWERLFADSDACVAPVLMPDEIWADPHVRARHPEAGPHQPPVVPRLSGMLADMPALDLTDRTPEILASLGLSEEEAARASADPVPRTGLSWPPVLR